MTTASMQVRLHNVAFPLLLAAAEWCPFEQEPTYGFFLRDQETSQGRDVGGTGQGTVVAYVHPQLPAQAGGLLLEDRVIEVNANRVSKLRADEVMLLVRRLTLARIQPLQLEIDRAGELRILTMWAVPACQFTVQVIESDVINGVTDGRRIGVTTGVMQFMRSDNELAWVLAHEIAHNVLSHVQNARLRMMLSAFLSARIGGGGAATASAPQRLLEVQADYVGLYIMARAGYDLGSIRQVWLRMGELSTQQATERNGLGITHPTTAERLAAFDATLKEIEGKQARGEPLQPLLEESR